MKSLLTIIGISVLFLGIAGCSPEKSADENDLRNKLTGKWMEIKECEFCRILTFSENDTIYITTNFGGQSEPEVYKMLYEIKSENSIWVRRLWTIEAPKKESIHKVEFFKVKFPLTKPIREDTFSKFELSEEALADHPVPRYSAIS